MGCVFSEQWRVREKTSQLSDDTPKTRDCVEDTEILSLTELGKVESHSFQGQKPKKKHHCSVCGQALDCDEAYCKECKTAVRNNCETKSFQNQRNPPPRCDNVEHVMERVMESHYDFDLIYITEKIISLFFLPNLEEHRYRTNLREVAAMLKSKHQDKFMVINLSEKRHDICRLNPKVEEFGWPDLHAPPLDKICSVCKSMERWLNSDPHNVIVLHCKGNRGKTGVITAAYMHYSKISAGADQALTTVAMRKFCEEKISSSLQPSQNRYIYYFAGLLSGTIKINSSPLLLYQVHIPELPNYQPGGGYAPFLKIYQSLKLVYTSSIYNIDGSRNRTLCIRIEPALQLKGDVMVKCYHRHSGLCERECVFRVQFHTCTVHGAQLWFGKKELDHACTDDRYPDDATVELVFSPGPEQARGREVEKNDPGRKVGFSCTDPVVRWDSYENFNLYHQDSTEDICHTRGPLDGSLYAQVKKRRVPLSSSNSCPPTIAPSTGTSIQTFQTLSPSSDSGLSSAPSDLLEEPPPPLPSSRPQQEGRERDREKQSVRERERETALLGDGDCSPLRVERPCCSLPYSRPQTCCGPDLPSTRPQVLHPKHHTLPCSHTSPLSTRQVGLLWERGRCQPCTHAVRPLYAYPSQEPHNHSPLTCPTSHAHTLPTQARLFGSEEPCSLFHFSAHSHSHTHIPPPLSSHQSLPPSPYCELRFSSTPPTSCSCRDCSHLREDLALHPLRVNQFEGVPWPPQEGFGCRREGPVYWTRDRRIESHCNRAQGPEYWSHRSVMPPKTSSYGHGHCHSASKQDPPVDLSDLLPDHPSGPYPSPHSSGYNSPYAPCPCSPSQARENPDYASMGQSLNLSPMAFTPSPMRESFSQHHIHSSPSTAGQPSRYQSHIDTRDDSEERISRNGLEINCIGAVSLQSRDSAEPVEPGNTDQSEVPQEEPLPQHGSAGDTTAQEMALSPETQTSEMKDGAVESASTTTLFNELSPSSDPPLSSLDVESPVLGGRRKENDLVPSTSICQAMEQNNDVCLLTKSISNTPGPSSCPSVRSSSSEIPLLRLTPVTDRASSNEEGSTSDLRSPSPVPDGYATPSFPLASSSYPLLAVPHVPYTGYTAVTIPASPPQPPLPEKQRVSPLQDYTSRTSLVTVTAGPSISPPQVQVSFSPMAEELPPSARPRTAPSRGLEELENHVSSKFVQDSSKFWYKPGISRDQAIAVLKNKEPGCFLIRDSSSFQGAYGLALKVATPPPHARNHGNGHTSQSQLVRHFLIESGAKGVKIKGCQNETYFGSLSGLVYHHSINPVSLPCKLHIPDKDLVGEMQELHSGSNTSTAADLLRQGAACNVLYLNSVDTESLTGPQAISKAINCTQIQEPSPSATVVHFKVSTQGITLTDNQRRLFFRRHYPIHSVTFSSVDPQSQRWTNNDKSSNKMFGFVARRSGSSGNVCHLFAELDPEQPATAIVNFINKVMLGPQQLRK
ncbi:tensin-2 isoform X2 [Electrophorus electricus]|uniref:tensin-2 isoform X2 n=1 Tax=Electrophorus electricus TaxID=8005 RepID=UPI0015D0294E|nr:tensin-2 isoform X2 [Electrophorus electricus]